MDETSLDESAELKAFSDLSSYGSLDAARYEVRRLYLLLLKQEPDAASWARMAELLVAGQARASDIVAELMIHVDFDRAWGLADNKVSTGHRSDSIPADAMLFEETVQRAFQLVLRRDPDDPALAAFSNAMASGNLDSFGLLEELLQSDEFAQVATRQPAAARYIIIPIARALWGRDPTEDEITAYGEVLHGQDGLYEVLQAILATGESMVHRHPPSEDVSKSAAYPSELQDFVHGIYNAILLRDADGNGLQSFATGLADGSLQVIDIVKELLSSNEFATTALRFPSVSGHVARAVLSTMMQREIEDSTINAYAGALHNGYPLRDFLLEILTSPEFKQQFSSPEVSNPKVDNHVTGELAGLAEGLLVNRMIQEGCRIPAAPYAASARSPVSNNKMAALIRTLGMLSRS